MNGVGPADHFVGGRCSCLLRSFLVAQSVFLALGVYLDRQVRPVFPRWVGHFNLLIAAALAPAAFTTLYQDGPFAWDGLVSFWVKNIAIGVWIVVMTAALAQVIYRQRGERGGAP